MKRAFILCSLLICTFSALATADEGMWLYNAFPKDKVKAKYHFEPSQAWLDHVQLASVRFNNGGSGSFVSADGLTFTNHHVGAGDLDKLGGDLSEDFVRDPNPWGGESIPVALDPSADMRSAWVALEDTANKRAVVVGMFSDGAGLAVWNKCVLYG